MQTRHNRTNGIIGLPAQFNHSTMAEIVHLQDLAGGTWAGGHLHHGGAGTLPLLPLGHAQTASESYTTDSEGAFSFSSTSAWDELVSQPSDLANFSVAGLEDEQADGMPGAGQVWAAVAPFGLAEGIMDVEHEAAVPMEEAHKRYMSDMSSDVSGPMDVAGASDLWGQLLWDTSVPMDEAVTAELVAVVEELAEAAAGALHEA
jgi:hypothetical protein